MQGFAANGSRPICALPDNGMGVVTVESTTTVEARIDNPLADLLDDPRAQLVFAVTVVAVPLGA